MEKLLARSEDGFLVFNAEGTILCTRQNARAQQKEPVFSEVQVRLQSFNCGEALIFRGPNSP